MRGAGGTRELSNGASSTWLVRILSVAFIGLGILFLVAPHAGAALFGLAAPGGEASGYLPAIGLRDLAFGLYLLILSVMATRRTLGLILAATLVIPIGDIILVSVARGSDAVLNLLLHGASAAVMAAGSIWFLRTSAHDKTGGQS
ncbi:DUF4267 domain-containing protein [Microvirga makkahensis]|uniref:DUF4267 domain-containing protein n=1 Tax=Microvirga makkahensis TaxID=1128670 RepID=A0A7X3MTN9_9HYPH|nr:DUF4267 domain-containing protein [Microvirga makkahensis]MXQ13012.1 DUF4267 domain-containing protein [Microvirga makkahensis]